MLLLLLLRGICNLPLNTEGKMNVSPDNGYIEGGRSLSDVSKDVDPFLENGLAAEFESSKTWQGILAHAPAAANLLGQLMVLASVADPEFKELGNNYTLLTEKTFGQGIIKASSFAYHAFKNASGSMHFITAEMDRVIKDMANIVTTAHQYDLIYVARMANSSFLAVKRSIASAAVYAASTKKGIDDMNTYMTEFNMAVLTTMDATKRLDADAKAKIETDKMIKNLTQIKIARFTKTVAENKALVERNSKLVADAINGLPSPYFLGFVSMFTAGCTAIAGISNAIVAVESDGTMGKNMFGKTTQQGGTASVPTVVPTNDITSADAEAVFVASGLEDGLKSCEEALGTPSDTKAIKGAAKNIVNFLGVQNKTLQNGKGSQFFGKVMQTIGKTNSTVQGILKFVDKLDKSDLPKYLNSLQSEITDFATVVADGNAKANGKIEKNQLDNEMATAKSPQEKIYLRAQQRLDIADQKLTKSQQDLEDTFQILEKTMIELTTLNIKTLDMDQVVETLRKAVIVMSKIQQFWEQFLEQFDGLSTLISVTMNDSMNSFVDRVNHASEYPVRQFLINSLKTIFASARYINMVGSMYIHVYDNYLVNCISAVMFEEGTQKEDVDRHMAVLSNMSLKAEAAVRKLANDTYFATKTKLWDDIFRIEQIRNDSMSQMAQLSSAPPKKKKCPCKKPAKRSSSNQTKSEIAAAKYAADKSAGAKPGTAKFRVLSG